MSKMFQQDQRIGDGRFLLATGVLIMVTAALLVRVWYLQIYKGEYYKRLSKNNRIQYMETPAPRGVIYDRHGQVVLGNRPYFDLVYIPQFVKEKDTTLKILSRLLHIPISTFERRIELSQGLPKYVPVKLKRNLSRHELATIESNKIFLPGIEITRAPRRDYKPHTPSHMVGYLGEINRKEMKRLNEKIPKNPYRPGDLVGKQGLEARWEESLRGERGHKLVQVDAFGRRAEYAQRKRGLDLPEVRPVPGSDLILTIDMDLQKATHDAFEGKNGAVVALDPRDGEILSMVSSPGYDPRIFQGGLSQEKYRSLLNNPFKPFLDKTTGGTYMPGSPYKAVLAMAALEEDVVTPETEFHCPGHFTLGDQRFHCHERAGHGDVDLKQALMKSCDVYFYNVGLELGVDTIAKYARALGLGQKLGVRLNFELPGLVPTSAWHKLTHRFPWTRGLTPNISIGQGANKMTPIQMASLYAAIANKGRVWRPLLVKKVLNHVGETVLVQDPQLQKSVDLISEETFQRVGRYLQAVVEEEEGTGNNAQVDGVTVAGKTGTVQVVSLDKNTTDLDVSMNWREHAIFAAYSPVDNAEISVAVISEHDAEGGGGVAAAPVAGDIIETYWKLKEKRSGLAMGRKTEGEEPDGVRR